MILDNAVLKLLFTKSLLFFTLYRENTTIVSVNTTILPVVIIAPLANLAI